MKEKGLFGIQLSENRYFARSALSTLKFVSVCSRADRCDPLLRQTLIVMLERSFNRWTPRKLEPATRLEQVIC
jgi:hypothetical protein